MFLSFQMCYYLHSHLYTMSYLCAGISNPFALVSLMFCFIFTSSDILPVLLFSLFCLSLSLSLPPTSFISDSSQQFYPLERRTVLHCLVQQREIILDVNEITGQSSKNIHSFLPVVCVCQCFCLFVSAEEFELNLLSEDLCHSLNLDLNRSVETTGA